MGTSCLARFHLLLADGPPVKHLSRLGQLFDQLSDSSDRDILVASGLHARSADGMHHPRPEARKALCRLLIRQSLQVLLRHDSEVYCCLGSCQVGGLLKFNTHRHLDSRSTLNKASTLPCTYTGEYGSGTFTLACTPCRCRGRTGEDRISLGKACGVGPVPVQQNQCPRFRAIKL